MAGVNYAKCLCIINSLQGHIAYGMPILHPPAPSRLTDSVGEVQRIKI